MSTMPQAPQKYANEIMWYTFYNDAEKRHYAYEPKTKTTSWVKKGPKILSCISTSTSIDKYPIEAHQTTLPVTVGIAVTNNTSTDNRRRDENCADQNNCTCSPREYTNFTIEDRSTFVEKKGAGIAPLALGSFVRERGLSKRTGDENVHHRLIGFIVDVLTDSRVATAILIGNVVLTMRLLTSVIIALLNNRR